MTLRSVVVTIRPCRSGSSNVYPVAGNQTSECIPGCRGIYGHVVARAMVGDYDRSLKKWQQAFAKGARWTEWSYDVEFYPMADDPRFIALKQQNLDAINSERAMLGWEPVAEVGIFIQ